VAIGEENFELFASGDFVITEALNIQLDFEHLMKKAPRGADMTHSKQ